MCRECSCAESEHFNTRASQQYPADTESRVAGESATLRNLSHFKRNILKQPQVMPRNNRDSVMSDARTFKTFAT